MLSLFSLSLLHSLSLYSDFITISKSHNLAQIKLKKLPDALLFIWNLIFTLHSSIDFDWFVQQRYVVQFVCGLSELWKFQNCVTSKHSHHIQSWYYGVSGGASVCECFHKNQCHSFFYQNEMNQMCRFISNRLNNRMKKIKKHLWFHLFVETIFFSDLIESLKTLIVYTRSISNIPATIKLFWI